MAVVHKTRLDGEAVEAKSLMGTVAGLVAAASSTTC
jgi:hypothetical protein